MKQILIIGNASELTLGFGAGYFEISVEGIVRPRLD